MFVGKNDNSIKKLKIYLMSHVYYSCYDVQILCKYKLCKFYRQCKSVEIIWHLISRWTLIYAFIFFYKLSIQCFQLIYIGSKTIVWIGIQFIMNKIQHHFL